MITEQRARELAVQAGEETGECFPSPASNWFAVYTALVWEEAQAAAPHRQLRERND